jgi:hypothetical protein
MGELAIKQRIRRAVKRAKKLLLLSGEIGILELKEKDYHLVVSRGQGYPPEVYAIRFKNDPDPPPLKNYVVWRLEPKNGGGFNFKRIN